MADLGLVAVSTGGERYAIKRFGVHQYPLNGAGTVSGVVTDDGGTPVARTVRIHHRATGVLLAETISDAGTGAYSVAVDTNDEVYVVSLDDDAGTVYNDKIAGRIIP